jgi:hypothetical protein
MRVPLFLAGLIACMISNVAATALTYKLTANEKACFYALTKKTGEKVAFYFAVSFPVDKESHLGACIGLKLTNCVLLGPIRWCIRCRLHRPGP